MEGGRFVWLCWKRSRQHVRRRVGGVRGSLVCVGRRGRGNRRREFRFLVLGSLDENFSHWFCSDSVCKCSVSST